MNPAGKSVLVPTATRTGDDVANDSEALRRLQDTWAKTGRDDRWAFLKAVTGDAIIICESDAVIAALGL